MDKKQILDEFNSLKYKGKPVYSDKKNGALSRAKKLNNKYLFLYYNLYHKVEYMPESSGFSYSKFEQYRPKIFDFFDYCQVKGIEIKEFNQDNLNEFCSTDKSAGSLRTKKTSVEQLLRQLSIFLDYNDIVSRIKKLQSKQDGARVLTSREIDRIRQFYRYDKFKLFVFEWIYSLEFDKNDFENFNIDDADFENNRITLGKVTKVLSENLSCLIKDIKDDKRFNKTSSVIEHNLELMEEELNKNKIIKGRFRDMDVKETIKQCKKFTCPECGTPYENIAENWVIKTYDNSNTKWIVCKEKCGRIGNE